MAEYPVNKGIGRSVEFKGLKAQYLFIFAGGLLVVFVLFVILYMAGVSQGFRIGSGVADFRPERPVRRTRIDEVGRGTQPSPLYTQPPENLPIVQPQKTEE